jgi:cell shape-determining protein MreC
MMNYHLDRQSKTKQKTKVLIGAVLVGGLVLGFMLIPSIGSLLQRSFIPIWERHKTLQNSLEDTALVINTTKRALIQENKELRSQLEHVHAAVLRMEALEGQIDELEEVLHRGDVEAIRTVAAVITSPRKNLYQSIMIDQGADSGIVFGDQVFVDTVLVGNVVQVQPRGSNVLLYSRYGSVVAGVLADGTAVDLKGAGAGNYEIALIRGVEVAAGDVIFDRSFRRNIIGVIDEVVFDPRDPYQKVLARVPYNLNMLRQVIVMPGQAYDFSESKDVSDDVEDGLYIGDQITQ